jgi:hypothetical protein
VPDPAKGLVVFAHGSGSSRFSSRNRAVAASLHEHRLGTLLLDLLTRQEESVDVYTAKYRFDIERLGRRVALATDWIESRRDVRSLPIGYFGRMEATRILDLKLVPGARHLFEERGTLEQVQRLAAEWFERHLTPSRST